jgi:hypothetical protein
MREIWMRFFQKVILFFILIAGFSGIARADDDQVYFVIKSERDKITQFAVTDAVIAKVGTVGFMAMVPGMDDKFHSVRGPRVRDLLAVAGVKGETAVGVALDKYEVEIPTSDFEAYDVIAATEVDGQAIDVRHKGPAWIVYPSADHPEFQKDPVYEARSIWQLKELVIK